MCWTDSRSSPEIKASPSVPVSDECPLGCEYRPLDRKELELCVMQMVRVLVSLQLNSSRDPVSEDRPLQNLYHTSQDAEPVTV